IHNNFVTPDEYYNFYMQASSISDIVDVYPQISEISYYIDKPGFVNYNDFHKVTEDIENIYWYKDVDKLDIPRWHVIKDIDNGTFSLCHVVPLHNIQKEFMGVAVISVNPEVFASLCDDLSSNRDVIFSAGQGIVFFSTVEEYSEGKVVPENKEKFIYGFSSSEIISDSSKLGKLGHTVVSYFDFENTGNLFQVYVINPNSIFSSHTNQVIYSYIWYISLCILLSVLIAYFFSSVFSRRIQFLKDQMHNVAAGEFELTEEIMGTDEIFDLYEDLKKMVDSMQTLINDAYKAKIQSESFKLNQVEAEFKALASQINPHFLYNTLETIRMKAFVNNDKETATLVKKLGKFMRRCLEVKDGMVTLESELEFTKSYLELQSARFGDRVTYSIYCEVDRQYKILPLIIQPIVENAFVHGVEGAKANGKISIKVFYKGENVLIEVSDNGCGIEPDKLRLLLAKLEENDTSSGKSIGLTNVNKRIKMYHGEQYGMSIETVLGQGTTIRLTIPREVDENVMKRLPEKYVEISSKLNKE
ncbi:MAG: sensor histidine kinase, partial [Oscillospiraceae bacterium]|nr:sensor histidine kinase [Oscillospiraceae bacterium]